MTDLETLVIEMASGLKLVTGMLSLTVALLPDADRAIVLTALAAVQAESGAAGNTDQSKLATTSSLEAGRALTTMIENFASEIASKRAGRSPA